MKPNTYEWLVDGRPDGKLRAIGDRVEMTEAQAKYHVNAGHLKRVEPSVKAASKAPQKAAKPPAESKPKDDAKA